MKLTEYLNYFLVSVNWPTVIVLLLIIIPVADTLFRMIASKTRSGLKAERKNHQSLRLQYCCLEDEMRDLRLENCALSQISTDLQNLADLGSQGAPRERPHPLSSNKALTKPEMTDIDDEVIDIIVVRDLFDDRGENGMETIQEQPEARQKEVIDLISVRDLFNDDNEIVALPDQYETEISIGQSADILTTRDELGVDVALAFDQIGESDVVKSDVVKRDEIADLPKYEDESDVDTARVFNLIGESNVTDEAADVVTSLDESEADVAGVYKVIAESGVTDEAADVVTSLDESESDVAGVFKVIRESDVVKGAETADSQTGDDEAAKGDTVELCKLPDADIHGNDLDTELPGKEDASRENDDAAMEQVAEQVIEPVSASTEAAAKTTKRSGVTDRRNGEAVEQNSALDVPDDEVGLIKLTDEERAILIAISKQRLDGLSSSGIISNQRVQLAINRLKEGGLIDEIDDEIVDSPAGQRWLDSRDSR